MLAGYSLALETSQQVITGLFNPSAPIHPGAPWEAHFSSVGIVRAAFN